MVKDVEDYYQTKILDELEKAKIDKGLIDSVYRISKKQIETLRNTIIEDEVPNTVQEVFAVFLETNNNDKL